MHSVIKLLISTTSAALILLLLVTQPLQAEDDTDIYSGYYSRDREDGKAAEIAGVSQYIKFYPDKWVVMIYIPYEYSLSLSPQMIHAALKDIKSQAKTQSYFKGKFGELEEKSVAHVEHYRDLGGGELEFECDGTAPCKARFSADTMELRKAGMLSNHIIDYNRVSE
ncbi:MAG: hypothetical protein L3J22_00135 [Xanthomonadales bacterium]|nr:hypothetical protein [Xanthomonadales bacterium]